jgi:hypothetical protein
VRQQRIEVNALKGCERIRLVLVQLRSPFSNGDGGEQLEVRNAYDSKGIFWTDKSHIQKRKEDFQAILGVIKSECFKNSVVRIVVFPEYAVPRDAHGGLQAFADESNCIVIPGSYYQSDESLPRKRNNICAIYLPRQATVTIVKKNGWRDEAEIIESDPDTPNIVHLAGDNDVLGDFSVSVAICRDYLMPYGEALDGAATCLLDFKNPGINVVVMCSSQMRLFESRAALDVRDLPGPRRITALCNCSGLGIERRSTVGTAILGPQEDPEGASSDIVKSLPGNSEGLIQADILLNMPVLAQIEVKPDKKTTSPVRHAVSYRFNRRTDPDGAPPAIDLVQSQDSGPLERGVWHPAFLEHMQLCMVLHLFRTRHVDLLENAISKYKIRNVSSFAIEGRQDALFHYYRSLTAGDADFRLKNCITLGEAEYRTIFLGQGHQIVIRPEDMMKFRSITIPPKLQNNGWEAEKKKIARLVPKYLNGERRARLMQITQLARDWNASTVSSADRERLSDVFLPEREYVATASAYASGRSDLRSKYVLVSDGASGGVQKKEFELEVINKRLLPLLEVRSIYKIDTTLDEAHFDYWIDIVAESWRIAEIVLSITAWGNRLGMETETQTMEVLKFYSTESVTGVYATDLPTEVLPFLYEVMQSGAYIDNPSPQPVIVDAYELLIACGTAWYQQIKIIEGPEAEATLEAASAFYVNLFFGNITTNAQGKRKHFDISGETWGRIYKKMETLFDDIIRKHFNVDDAAIARKLAIERLEHLGVPLRDNDKNVLKTYAIPAIFRLMKHDKELPFQSSHLSRLSTIYEGVRDFRAALSHGDERILKLLTAYPLAGPEAREAIRNVIDTTGHLFELVNASYSILNSF